MHNVLLTKLVNFGFGASLITFLKSYLADRKYSIHCHGHKSRVYIGTSGVPQGSNLGPLLFLLFINDVTRVVSCNKALYADDLKLFTTIESHGDCRFLQRQIGSLSEWCHSNGLFPNIRKCMVITYTKNKNPVFFQYSIGDIPLSRTKQVKDLGVMFCCDLSFSRHVDDMVRSAYKMLGFVIRNSRSFSNIETVKTLYYAFVRSRLEYCSVVWSPFYEVHKHEVEVVQRKLLKFLYYKSHGIYPFQGYDYKQLCSEFNVVSLEARRTLAAVIFLFKLVNCEIDCDFLLRQISFRQTRHTDRVSVPFRCPQVRTNLGLSSPLCVMQRSFNVLARCNTCNIFYTTESELARLVLNTF